MADLSQYSDVDIINIVSSDAESELKSRGYDYGWYKKEPYVGSIYILVNPAFKELVKIGYADDVQKRMRTLNNNSGLPDPFHCYAVYRVKKRLEDLKLHGLIDTLDPSLRHSKNREFYEMDAEKAYSILSAIAQISGDEEQLIVNPFKDEYFKLYSNQNIPSINFIKKDINDISTFRYEYWLAFKEYGLKSSFFMKEFHVRKENSYNWKHYSIGVSKISIVVSFYHTRNGLSVELNIKNNKVIYHKLLLHKDNIESECQLKFNWKELPNKKMSRIIIEKTVNLLDKTDWHNQFEWLVNTMVCMKTVFKKYL